MKLCGATFIIISKEERKMNSSIWIDARFIIVGVMGVVLFAWVVFCGIQFIRHGKGLIVKAGFTAHVKCEKCGTVYEVDSAELAKVGMSKSKSMIKTKIVGPAFINRPHYSYYAKKFNCPSCRKRRYAQVLDINELNDMMTGVTLKTGIRWLVIMAVGGLLILAISAIPMHFVNEAADKHIEELKQQRYEDFKERYGL